MIGNTLGPDFAGESVKTYLNSEDGNLSDVFVKRYLLFDIFEKNTNF